MHDLIVWHRPEILTLAEKGWHVYAFVCQLDRYEKTTSLTSMQPVHFLEVLKPCQSCPTGSQVYNSPP